ncbi:hypothetical protein SISNIDRAFT_491896 [Sistotremastrum niveocremeum HHB9708]|uniref:Uncharacterized protein n=1 Tax=Sistotremastrum niveocremeum HHB9708 TaxID=1314777 RepID=A0A164MA36_9AGAM|nr:hypothetical protein SISNIDRAFT_491896 [Sistotremastrum niveocremeum HHB9708]
MSRPDSPIIALDDIHAFTPKGAVMDVLYDALLRPTAKAIASNVIYIMLWAYLAEFGDPSEILRVMKDSEAILTGPAVLSLLNGGEPLIVAPRAAFMCNTARMNILRTFFVQHGYNICSEGEHVPSMDEFLSGDTVAHIQDDWYLKRIENGTTRAIDLYAMNGDAPDLVPTFNTTLYMNFFFHNGLVMLYPAMTMDGVGLVREMQDDERDNWWPEKLGGYRLTEDVMDVGGYPSACPARRRAIGDGQCLEVTFQANAGGATKFIHLRPLFEREQAH